MSMKKFKDKKVGLIVVVVIVKKTQGLRGVDIHIHQIKRETQLDP